MKLIPDLSSDRRYLLGSSLRICNPGSRRNLCQPGETCYVAACQRSALFYTYPSPIVSAPISEGVDIPVAWPGRSAGRAY